MSGNKIEYLPDKSFSGNKKLTILRLKNNPIMSVGLKAFANLPRLENLYVFQLSFLYQQLYVQSFHWSKCKCLMFPIKDFAKFQLDNFVSNLHIV